MMRACLDCGTPTPVGNRCARHRIHYGYATSHWLSVRKQRLALDGHLCQLRRDNGCTVRATTVHLDPRCNGNHALATLDNTVSACLHCHGVEDAPRASGYRGEGMLA
jgi:5-methylcytosine-specific restriction endonuclease McrA